MFTAICHHALITGFARAFLIAAGIALLNLAITIAAIRVRRADLTGAQRPATTMPPKSAQPQ